MLFRVDVKDKHIDIEVIQKRISFDADMFSYKNLAKDKRAR